MQVSDSAYWGTAVTPVARFQNSAEIGFPRIRNDSDIELPHRSFTRWHTPISGVDRCHSPALAAHFSLAAPAPWLPRPCRRWSRAPGPLPLPTLVKEHAP